MAWHLEVLCGLQSRILAESEVASQFRGAYRDYARRKVQKFPDSFDIGKAACGRQKNSLRPSSKRSAKQSYGGIVRKILLSSPEQKGRRLLVKGSGALAEEIVKLLKKSFSRLYQRPQRGGGVLFDGVLWTFPSLLGRVGFVSGISL